MEISMMKYSMTAFTVLALCSVALLQAYPNEVKIKNNSGSKIIFYCYFMADEDIMRTPMAHRSHHVLEPQETGTFDGIVLFGKMHSFEWEKITASEDREFPKGMTGGEYREIDSFAFDKDFSGSIYLIYSDSGFKVVTEQEWDTRNQNTKK